MANASAYAEKAMLDWVFGGATPTRPSARWLGISYGSPTSVSASEWPFSRATIVWGAAASPAGTVANNAAASFAATTWASTLSGYQIWDASVGGNMLAYGLLDAKTNPSTKSGFTCAIGSAIFAAL